MVLGSKGKVIEPKDDCSKVVGWFEKLSSVSPIVVLIWDYTTNLGDTNLIMVPFFLFLFFG